MLPLATQLSILIPPMILFQTFILEFGLMEFGTIIGFIMKPLFKVTEMASVSIISAWLGPVSAGAMAAKQFFDEGYFTPRANVLGVMDYFSAIHYLGASIPPLSLYPESYKPGVVSRIS